MNGFARQREAGSILLGTLLSAAIIATILVLVLFSGLWHGAGFFYIVLGSVSAALMGFSRRDIAQAFRSGAGGADSTVDLKRSAYFWEAAARNAWILGVLGSALNFSVAIGGENGGLENITHRAAQAFVVGLYGAVMAAICLIPSAKIRAGVEGAAQPRAPVAPEPARGISARISLPDTVLGYVLFVLVLASAGYSLVRGEAQTGPLSLLKIMLHGPAILVVVGGTVAVAIFIGTGLGGRVWTLGLAVTGLVSLLMGFVQALFGYVHHNIQEISAALIFIVSSSSFALLGMLVVGAPLEDRKAIEEHRESPGSLSRMAWIIFPLVAYIFLVLAFILVITPMKQTVGG